MQENDFEKKLRLKMEELALVPGEEVWKKVELRIQKEKTGKRFLIFLLAFAFLAGTITIYLFTQSNSSSTKNADAATAYKTSPPVETSSTPATKPASPTRDRSTTPEQLSKTGPTATTGANGSPTPLPGASSILTSRPGSIKGSQSGVAKKSNTASRLRNTPAGTRLAGQTETFKDSPLATAFSQNSPTGARKENATKMPPGKAEGTAMDVNNLAPVNIAGRAGTPNAIKTTPDTLQTAYPDSPGSNAETTGEKFKPNEPAQQAPLPRTTPEAGAANKASKKPVVGLKNSWKFGISVFTGVSNNLSGLNILSSPGAASYQPNTPGLGTAAAGNQPITKLQYTSGFSYGLGIYTRKHIGKNTWFSAGIDYLYASAISIAGDPVNTTRTFFDVSLQNNATVPAYYVAGKTARYTNRYHLLEVPVQFLWQVNRRQDKPVLFMAGIVPSYLIASQALYANLNQNVYYTDNAQFKKWQLAAQAGVEFPLMLQKHFTVSAGPQVQYGLNNMVKTASGTNQHLISGGLKVNITIH